MHQRKFGWKPQLPDHRDKKYMAPAATPLPAKADNRPKFPPVYDQGSVGSCTANALAGMVHHDLMDEKKVPFKGFVPSRLFIYYNERVDDGDPTVDAGSTIREGIKTLHNQGFCSETVWPYVESEFATKPSDLAYQMAVKHRVQQYLAIDQTLFAMQHCLAQDLPIALGISVYDSFMTDPVTQTGLVPMPGKDESLLGGHAVLLVGYDNSKAHFIVRNSWGESWGDRGYFYLPYAYVLDPNLAADFWCVKFCP